MSLLAGDIGGTKTLLQLQGAAGKRFERRYDSSAFTDFGALLADFLLAGREAGLASPDSACIAVAGPVDGRRARVTNLPWALDADALQARFGIAHVHLINDFQAVGYGLATLQADDLLVLQTGEVCDSAPRALIGAGTGLGEGILLPAGGRYEVLPSEGGHVDFAPTDALQRELLAWLSEREARVSYESLVSGPGLETIYRFHAMHFPALPSADVLAALARGEGAAAISRAAAAGDVLAAKTLDMFVTIYGAQAGNLALTCLAAGGVYVAGGIAPRLRERITDGRFMAAFCDKGKMAGLLERYPVYLLLNARTGLQGAADVAARLSR